MIQIIRRNQVSKIHVFFFLFRYLKWMFYLSSLYPGPPPLHSWCLLNNKAELYFYLFLKRPITAYILIHIPAFSSHLFFIFYVLFLYCMFFFFLSSSLLFNFSFFSYSIILDQLPWCFHGILLLPLQKIYIR